LQQQQHHVALHHNRQQQQWQQQQRRVQAQALQVDLLLGGLSGVSGWVLVAVLVAGMLLGLALAKVANNYLRTAVDPYWASLENAELRTKVSCEMLIQLVRALQ
jgi:hypothetical protein